MFFVCEESLLWGGVGLGGFGYDVFIWLGFLVGDCVVVLLVYLMRRVICGYGYLNEDD